MVSKQYPHIAKIYKKTAVSGQPHLRENLKPLHTPVNTPVYSEASQGQFSWHLKLDQVWCVCREVNGSREADPFGELDILISTL